MSIIHAYEPGGDPIITPEKFYPKLPKIASVAVVCFSYKALNYVLDHYEHELYFPCHATANGVVDIYYLPQFKVLFLMSPIGSGIAGGLLQEIAYFAGIEKFVYFGSCGVLDSSLRGHFIVPTSVYREDGYSYHYAPPSDYLDMQHHDEVSSFIKKKGLPFVSGKGWTTDAIFNETKAKWEARRKEGVVCVDMEASGLQAIASSIGVDLYLFFFAGDILGENWSAGDHGGEKERVRQESAVRLALELGQSLVEG